MIESRLGLEDLGIGGGAPAPASTFEGRLAGTGGGVSVDLFRPHSSADFLGAGGSFRTSGAIVWDRAGTAGRAGSVGGRATGDLALFVEVMALRVALKGFCSSCFLAGKGGSLAGSKGGARI